MPKPCSSAAIPKIETIKKGVYWEVHWDYQEAPESSILFQRGEYLRGYIDGTMDDLNIHPDNVCCASGQTGTVKKLNKDQATRLRDALNRVLIPIVTKEFTRLENMINLPHLRMIDSNEA